MANWASVSYRIEGKQKDLQEIYELFGEFDKGERKPFDELSAKNWEGNIAWALGEDIKDYYLRGFIQCCEIEKGLLTIEAEEAWGTSDFRHILEKHYEDMKVYFIVEEEGNEVYATNDSEGKYFSTEQEALQYIAERLELDSITTEQLATWQECHVNGDDYMNFNQYKIVA